MSNFHFVFRNSIMFINFGELPYATILKLCGFMKVYDFPSSFWNFEAGNVHELVMEFYSRDEVVVNIDGVECYHGDDFGDAMVNPDYNYFFNNIIEELREDDREEKDILEDLRRETDYLNLFENVLDDEQSRVFAEQEDRMVNDLELDTKTEPERGFFDFSDSDEDHA